MLCDLKGSCPDGVYEVCRAGRFTNNSSLLNHD